MNPPLTFANALTQLKLMTTQTANFTFTNDELTQALTIAWQDSFAGNIVWDSSVQYVMGTYQYAIPATLTTVREIYIVKPETNLTGAGGNYPEPISQDLYDIVNGKIQFRQIMQNFVGNSVTLYLKGFYSLTVNDNLITDNQVNYVLHLAAYSLLRSLLLKRVFVFLRNDTTTGDIKLATDIMRNEVLTYKQRLLREFESN
jgi:hypothetical protein